MRYYKLSEIEIKAFTKMYNIEDAVSQMLNEGYTLVSISYVGGCRAGQEYSAETYRSSTRSSNKVLFRKSDLVMNKELAKTLTTALVQFIDRERPEGTMCCSNIDCENIRWAFEEGEYEVVEFYLQHKLSRMTEFEQGGLSVPFRNLWKK